MGADSKISWTDHSYNPWWGCTHAGGPGCDNCYAETLSRRYGHDIWGNDRGRRTFGDRHWNEPLRWNRAAEKEGVRKRVFCASMADVFESPPEASVAELLDGERAKLWPLIEATPWLDWLLLTKRPQNAARMVPWTEWPSNVWLGASVETQRYADLRVPQLLAVPARVRFLSCEPLVGPVNLAAWLSPGCGLHWLVVGGESGPNARVMHTGWAHRLLVQGAENGVAVHMKQTGTILAREWGLRSLKGDEPSEWPPEFQVREYPTAAA